jgi:hypothetical protein
VSWRMSLTYSWKKHNWCERNGILGNSVCTHKARMSWLSMPSWTSPARIASIGEAGVRLVFGNSRCSILEWTDDHLTHEPAAIRGQTFAFHGISLSWERECQLWWPHDAESPATRFLAGISFNLSEDAPKSSEVTSSDWLIHRKSSVMAPTHSAMMQLHPGVYFVEGMAINDSLADSTLGARRERLSESFRLLRDNTRRERWASGWIRIASNSKIVVNRIVTARTWNVSNCRRNSRNYAVTHWHRFSGEWWCEMHTTI